MDTIEITQGITAEEMRALFFDAQALREPPYKLFQINQEGYRYYCRKNDFGEVELYPSVTTLLHQTMPTSPFLIKWMMEQGAEGAVEKRDLAAAYGTFMHAQFESLIINRRYDFDAVPVVLLDFMQRENIPDKVFNEWAVKVRKDVLAFAQFVKDYNVKPLAVEIALYHPDYRFAGCVDLPCVMTDPKTKETFTAIVDFKSGRKGFYEEHELQLHLYKSMWDLAFPSMPVERLYNFSPKDWRKGPTYNLKDQTASKSAAMIPHLLNIARIKDEERDNTLTVVRGVLNLDSGDLADNILTLSLADLIKSKTEDAEKGEETPQISAQSESEGNDTTALAKAKKTAKSKKTTDELFPGTMDALDALIDSVKPKKK